MRAPLLVLLLALPAFAAELSPELQVALQSLRPGERARLEQAVGPADAMPLYRGDFAVDLAAKRVAGKVAVSLTTTRDTDEVLFRVTPNATHPGSVIITGVRVNGANAKLAQPDPSLYRVVVAPQVAQGQRLTVELTVTASVPEQLRSKASRRALSDEPGGDYGAFSETKDVWNLAGLMPMVPAERHGKVMEGPSGIGDLGSFAPSNFVVSVEAPSGWKVLSAGLLMGEVPRNGAVRTAYTVAGARELPLLLVHQPKVQTRTVGEVTVESYTFGADEKSGQHVVEHAAKALELLDRKLGPYPYKALRVVEAHFFGGAGGMEFPGLVTVSSNLYGGDANPLEGMGLSDEQAQLAMLLMGPALKQLIKNTLEFTIDHEVAHQYTAMLVGSDPIAEPLADEPLTQHLALLLMEWRQGKKAADEFRAGQLKASYQLHRMMGGADAKANRATHEYSSNREYAALVYGKAPLAFDAMREVVGPAQWEAALRRYVEEQRYRWVGTQTLVDQVAKAHPTQGKKLKGLARRWWDEAHGDEDIGGANLEDLLSGGAAAPAGFKADPQVVKAVEELMKALSAE